ncbi:MAG: solute carrier family 23 protein [Pseudomonadota bacterium]
MEASTRTFALGDRPPLVHASVVGVQHLLAVFGGIVTAPLLIALGMQLPAEQTAYLISSALFVSGVATLLQVSRIGPVGSGLLSIQGTSFTFVGPLIYVFGLYAPLRGADVALGIVFTACLVCALIIAALSPFLKQLKKILTNNVSAAIVLLLGITLVWTTIGNIGREIVATTATGAPAWQAWMLSAGVIGVILLMAFSKRPLFRMASVVAGLIAGAVAAAALGWLSTPDTGNIPAVFFPTLGRYAFNFEWAAVLILLPVFLVSATESIGDLTATGNLSGISTVDASFFKRLRGGILADAINSAVAALLATFPNTTFSQNNGVIRLTGVSSRRVGRVVAVLLILLGATPVVAAWVQALPGLVIASATLLMFAMVAVSGVQIARAANPTARDWMVIGVSVSAGLLATTPMATEILARAPEPLANFFGFPVSSGAFFAIVLDAVLPHRQAEGI